MTKEEFRAYVKKKFKAMGFRSKKVSFTRELEEKLLTRENILTMFLQEH